MFVQALLLGHLEWNIPMLITLIGTGILYIPFIVTNKNTIHTHTNKRTNPCRQALFFFSGLCLFYLMLGSPFSSISHLSVSLHMFQMSMLYFIVPPLLLLGMPWFPFLKKSAISSRHRVKNPVMAGIHHVVFHPFFAVSLFAVFFLLYHVPTVLQFLSSRSLFHHAYTALLLASAFIMWHPIARPHQEQHITERYAHWNSALLMPACLLQIFYACFGGTNNPFLNQLTAHLCLPPQTGPFEILPPPFNTGFDQIIAGISMLGIHKIAIILTCRWAYPLRHPGLTR